MKVSDNAAERTDDQAEEISGWSPNVIWKTIGPALTLMMGVSAVVGITKLLPFFIQEDSTQSLRVVLGVAAVSLAGAMTVRHRKQWVLPSMRLRKLIHEIRVGRAPIEEFNMINPGCLEDLAAEMKLLLRELRQQRYAIVSLNDEVKQRIANRNSVLEGTIASLRHQAVRDSLTGLYNRRMLDQMLPQLITHQLHAENKSLTLMMIDLDYFKTLNDVLGHAAGDELLKSIGQIIHSTIRDGDLGFRYGGDEFVIVLPGCEAAAAKRVGERLQSLVSSLGKTYKLGQSVGMSFGIVSLAELPQPTAVELLRVADSRLYEVKARRGTRLPVQAA